MSINPGGKTVARYRPDPDFTRPVPPVLEDLQARMRGRLEFLYGPERATPALQEIVRLIRVHIAHKPDAIREAEASFDPSSRFSHEDAILIAYGDMVRDRDRTGLAALHEFLQIYRRGSPIFSILHVLPFFPSTSDRGFSVVDFKSVDPKLGSWEDILRLDESYGLMFDGVLNHVSSRSPAFRQMLAGNPAQKDVFPVFRSPEELTTEQRNLLRRPRTSDVLTRFDSLDGPIWAWTTFSPDQVDLNYANPRVLIQVIDTLLFYVRMGADLIRLDAVTYLWKQLGTSSASLEQTHAIVKLLRDVLDAAAPTTALVSETNVPHAENVSYFGSDGDEAQMVYNFALPPLVLHAFYRGDASWLTRWARDLQYPGHGATFLNFLDSHDGIGVLGAQDILPAGEMNYLIDEARNHGAFISYRTANGGEQPYEINSTWYSALNPEGSAEPRELQVRRFLASRSIALALKGVPGVYLHSMMGSRNAVTLALESKSKRDVNRATLDYQILQNNLNDPASKISLISGGMRNMLRTRKNHPAFHPNGEQVVVDSAPELFAVWRKAVAGSELILCVTNVSGRSIDAVISLEGVAERSLRWYELLAGRGLPSDGPTLRLRLEPYEVMWLTPYSQIERRIESRS
jgi:sucrose phosphorylase